MPGLHQRHKIETSPALVILHAGYPVVIVWRAILYMFFRLLVDYTHDGAGSAVTCCTATTPVEAIHRKLWAIIFRLKQCVFVEPVQHIHNSHAIAFESDLFHVVTLHMICAPWLQKRNAAVDFGNRFVA